MNRRFFALAAALAIGLAACDSGSSSNQSSAPSGGGAVVGGGGGGGQSGGGGGDVTIGAAGGETQESLQGRYQRALDLVKSKNVDAAYSEMKDLSNPANGDIAKNAAAQLPQLNTLLFNQPVVALPDILSSSGDYIEKIASVKGTYGPGGQTGQASEYFWIKSGGKVIQVNYSHMGLDDKKHILAIAEGSPILVRGRIKPPWSTRAKPYLELLVFWVLGAPQ